MYSITDVANKFNVSLRTIRYYEEVELISKGIRKNGIRYFQVAIIEKEMGEILFLKSLNYKLSEIKSIIKNPLYVKEILINMKIFDLESSIIKKNEEKKFFLELLNKKKWPIAKVSNNEARYNLKKDYEKIYYCYNDLKSAEYINERQISDFFEKYLLWHQHSGMNISFKHLKYMKRNPESINDSFLKYILNRYEI